ncbi:MAG: DMT family transporter [Planctomycetes bacterium]|nr:DMT family transporter [Planctomycetota bacterium]
MSSAHVTSPQERKAALALLAVTFIWGLTFVWMKQAIDADVPAVGRDLGAFSIALFLVLRFGLAAIVLALVVPSARRGLDARAWRGGTWLGGLLFGGFLLQMWGLEGVSPAVSAFLTSLYVVFTALLSAAHAQKPPHPVLVVGALLATFGGAFIGGPPQLTFGLGEWLTVGCALVFAVHILATDRITKSVAPMPVTFTSFAVVTLAALPLLVLFAAREHVTASETLALLGSRGFLVPLAGSSLLATVVAISLMNVFQRELDPVRAAILYALEPVWAAVISIGVGTDTFDRWLWIGGGALLAGNVIAELGPLLARRRAERSGAGS